MGKVAFLFAGQGAQHPGMCADLIESEPAARAVFEAANGNGEKVVPVSTADYYAGAAGPIAPRPVHSALDLSRLESVGFHMPDWEEELGEYLK